MDSLHPNLLTYKNQLVIARYRNEYPNSKMSAEEVFSELMKYFWLCQKHASDKDRFPNDDSLNFKCVMHAEMEEIDNMWHTFLIFTREYHEFCNHFCNGTFIHHDPLIEKANNSKEIYESELHKYLSYIYENLGEDTLVKWFKNLEE